MIFVNPGVNAITVASMMGVKMGYGKEPPQAPRKLPPPANDFISYINQKNTEYEKMILDFASKQE